MVIICICNLRIYVSITKCHIRRRRRGNGDVMVIICMFNPRIYLSMNPLRRQQTWWQKTSKARRRVGQRCCGCQSHMQCQSILQHLRKKRIWRRQPMTADEGECICYINQSYLLSQNISWHQFTLQGVDLAAIAAIEAAKSTRDGRGRHGSDVVGANHVCNLRVYLSMSATSGCGGDKKPPKKEQEGRWVHYSNHSYLQ